MKNLIMLAFFAVLYAAEARATECPPPPQGVAPGCKIITVNPAEELSLIGPNNILDAALWARRMELDTVTRYWRDKLQSAPAGGIAKPPAKE